MQSELTCVFVFVFTCTCYSYSAGAKDLWSITTRVWGQSPRARVWLSTINPMGTVLYYISYLIGLTSSAACVSTKNYGTREISVIFPGEYHSKPYGCCLGYKAGYDVCMLNTPNRYMYYMYLYRKHLTWWRHNSYTPVRVCALIKIPTPYMYMYAMKYTGDQSVFRDVTTMGSEP